MVPSPRARARLGISDALLLVLIGGLSGVIVGWLATVFFRG
jgi:hypothetical protein